MNTETSASAPVPTPTFWTDYLFDPVDPVPSDWTLERDREYQQSYGYLGEATLKNMIALARDAYFELEPAVDNALKFYTGVDTSHRLPGLLIEKVDVLQRIVTKTKATEWDDELAGVNHACTTLRYVLQQYKSISVEYLCNRTIWLKPVVDIVRALEDALEVMDSTVHLEQHKPHEVRSNPVE